MKKTILILSLVIILLFVIFCCCACNKMPYSLQIGAYGFEKTYITNILTKETAEKEVNDILNDDNAYKEWGNLLSFQIKIDENTKYFRDNDNKYFVIFQSLAFEVIDNDTLQLHFPYWRGYDNNAYDVIIILKIQVMYC